MKLTRSVSGELSMKFVHILAGIPVLGVDCVELDQALRDFRRGSIGHDKAEPFSAIPNCISTT